MSRTPILPGATIGVMGGGQLGRMLVLEARRMGYRTLILDPAADAPAAQLSTEHIQAPLDDLEAARDLARRSDVVTLEWENASVAAITELSEITPVRPGAHVLQIAQHRVREKEAARQLGLRTANFRAVRTRDELIAAVDAIGIPSVLKTARGGYDGKGQRVLRDRAEIDAAFDDLSDGQNELILEQWIDFRLEISVVCARTPGGEVRSFPVVENIHRNGILDFTIAPARIEPRLQEEARRMGEALVEGLDVVGILAVELFVGHDDKVYVNEIAPRPHNSGHYTWEACALSQFEQQLRAVCDLPLGSPTLLRPAAMANLMGEEIGTGEALPSLADTLALPMVSLHLYGKSAARTGRKMGHLTALAETADEALERVRRARELLIGRPAEVNA
jgi:5-(carboxyamino)imidazole ribonucleotide synthase